jgi:hypothetical protein
MNEQNYGEAIAYWYLRLNGFFIISDFALHRPKGYPHTSDADLLGLRMPCTTERIDGKEVLYCAKLSTHIDLNKQCGIICEVKTGKLNETDKAELFWRPYVDYSIDRIGFSQDNSLIKKTLEKDAAYNSESVNIIKLLIADVLSDESKNYKFISLDDAYNFIKARVATSINTKFPDRFFLKSAFIQNLIWQEEKTKNTPKH